jgi:transposase
VRQRREQKAEDAAGGSQLHQRSAVLALAGNDDDQLGEVLGQLRHHRGYQAIQAIDGVGRTIAAVLVAEIGDVDRFRSAEALCSWAGLTPKHRESDTTVRRGRITKQGSRLVRWALIEAVSRYHGGPALAVGFRRIAERRGTNKARVAVARKVLTLVYYGLRDGEIRCLKRPGRASAMKVMAPSQ